MNIIKAFKTYINKPKKPKKQTLYAITNGVHMGLFVIFIDPKNYPIDGKYAVMIINGKDMDGGMEAMEIPEKDIKEGIELGILDKVRKVPNELYTLCCNEYKERVKRKENEPTD